MRAEMIIIFFIILNFYVYLLPPLEPPLLPVLPDPLDLVALPDPTEGELYDDLEGLE